MIPGAYGDAVAMGPHQALLFPSLTEALKEEKTVCQTGKDGYIWFDYFSIPQVRYEYPRTVLTGQGPSSRRRFRGFTVIHTQAVHTFNRSHVTLHYLSSS